MKPIAHVACILAAYAGIGQAAKVPVDISDVVNHAWTIFDGGETMPTGIQQYNGVPFNIPAGEKNALIKFGGGLQTATIMLNVEGATTVHTLMATVWGQPGPTSFASLKFMGSEGAEFTLDLLGNRELRDFNPPPQISPIVSTTPQRSMPGPALFTMAPTIISSTTR